MGFLAAWAALTSDHLLQPVLFTSPKPKQLLHAPERSCEAGITSLLASRALCCSHYHISWPSEPGCCSSKPPQLGSADSWILLSQQREGVGVSHVTFGMTVTKTLQLKKSSLSKHKTPTAVKVWGVSKSLHFSAT